MIYLTPILLVSFRPRRFAPVLLAAALLAVLSPASAIGQRVGPAASSSANAQQALAATAQSTPSAQSVPSQQSPPPEAHNHRRRNVIIIAAATVAGALVLFFTLHRGPHRCPVDDCMPPPQP